MQFDLSQVKMSYHDRNRGLKLPEEPSEELAELIGILAGDGHADFHPGTYDYLLQINGHLFDDREYYQTYVQPLIKHLFNIKLREVHRASDTSIILTRKSKGILSFLKVIGFRKKDCIITIPPWIINNPRYTEAFMRGIFDTDGGLSLKKDHGRLEKYPVIAIGLKDTKTVFYLMIWTKIRNVPFYFGSRISKWKYKSEIRKAKQFYIQINGYKNIGKWMQTIGSSNPHKLKKIKCGWLDLNQRQIQYR